MKGFLIAVIFLIIGGAIGGFVALGLGSVAGLVTGSQAGVWRWRRQRAMACSQRNRLTRSSPIRLIASAANHRLMPVRRSNGSAVKRIVRRWWRTSQNRYNSSSLQTGAEEKSVSRNLSATKPQHFAHQHQFPLTLNLNQALPC